MDSNMPEGSAPAFRALMRRVDAFDSHKARAIDFRSEELRDEAKLGGKVSIGLVSGTPSSWLMDYLPMDVVEFAVNAWLQGDIQKSGTLFESACELAFEKTVDYLAEQDASREVL